MRVGGDTIAVEPSTWLGSRDRSWGIRPVGDADAPGRTADDTGTGGFWWLYVPLRFEEFSIIVMAQERPDGYRTLNDAKRVWADGRVEQLGWPVYDITYRSGSRHPEHATLRMHDMRGKPVTVEIDTLGFVPLHLGPGYGDADWAHGQWKGAAWAEAVVVDLTDPAVSPRIPFGNIDHVARAAATALRASACSSTRASACTRRPASPTSCRWHRERRRPLRGERGRRARRARRSRPLQRAHHRDGRASSAAVFADLRDDRSVRAVVLAGRGRGFCAGANMTGDDATPPERAGPWPGRRDPLHPGATSPS